MTTPRLLLVADDEEDNRIISSAILTHHRYHVTLVINGQKAVEQARRHAPDLIRAADRLSRGRGGLSNNVEV